MAKRRKPGGRSPLPAPQTPRTPSGPSPAPAAERLRALLRVLPRFPRIEGWLRLRLNLLVLVCLAVLLAHFAWTASLTFLNPDEATHYQIAKQESLRTIYQTGLALSHPPLFYWMVHFWLRLGESEAVLRLLPAIFGCLFLWYQFRWVSLVLGQSAGLLALALAGLSQATIDLSVELRGYTCLLACVTGAACHLELSFQARSRRHLLISTVYLCGALMSHFSAVWAVAALGLATLFRLRRREWPRQVLVQWVVLQAVGGAVWAWLVLPRVWKSLSWVGHFATHDYLSHQFLQPGQPALGFTLTAFLELFHYFQGWPPAGYALLGAVLAGGVLLLSKPSRLGIEGGRDFALLALLPFGLACLGALFRVYPMGGSRHSVVLLPFAAALASLPLSLLAGRGIWPAALLALALGIPWRMSALPHFPANTVAWQARQFMSDAVEYLRTRASPGAIIFVDLQSRVMLNYYLCRGNLPPAADPTPGFPESTCQGYRIVTAHPSAYNITEAGFREQFELFRRSARLQPAQEFWLFDAGWGGGHIRSWSGAGAAWAPTNIRTGGPFVTVARLERRI